MWKYLNFALVISPLTFTVFTLQQFSFGTCEPGWSRKKGHKTPVVVMVTLQQLAITSQLLVHYNWFVLRCLLNCFRFSLAPFRILLPESWDKGKPLE